MNVTNMFIRDFAYKNIYPIMILGMLFMYKTTALASEEWITEEVLNQLSEIKRDMKDIKNELQEMRGEISNIQTAILGKKKATVRNVKFGDKPILGKDDAKVAIIEFSDFQCPYCNRHNKQTLPKLKEQYMDSGKVKYVMRDFPLGFHRQAKIAAIAANCAGEQGKYWPMHDKLFENARKLKRELFVELAKGLKLDDKKYVSCLDDPKQAKQVEQDIAYGGSLGVSGTPAFFIGRIKDGVMTNVRPLSGAQPYERFAQIIDGYLK